MLRKADEKLNGMVVVTEPDITTLRLDRPGVRAALGDLEAEIMEVVWAHPAGEEITVRDVFEALYERRRIAYTTVMNTITRLARKGLLTAERKEPAYTYHPTMSRDQFIDRFVGEALERLLTNFSGATAAHLRQVRDPAAQTRLLQLIEQAEERRRAEERD